MQRCISIAGDSYCLGQGGDWLLAAGTAIIFLVVVGRWLADTNGG
ncbi:hypothetical protein [Jannaschia aquimarina]|uniref:Uncharacterized protein n=1 Tax=Jannaschia aquimarina TaxID=935700 RepID=A0A0D1E9G8_9RHOB|nr:hypothetical protein [Jannaschia aquimarina]KIT14279.1 hypothetical protein jaqu_40730 [Jannaschia aquimarina]SNS49867.1 hypothetical protein SAMN05421775_101192 [Jannaschia aquimarina]